MIIEEDPLEHVRKQYIQDLRTGQAYSIGKFDDQVLLISSGTLVLSLNFIKDIVPLAKAHFLWLLYASWWTLTVSIVVSIAAHLISYHLTERQIKRVENKKDLPDDKTIIRLNYITASLLILGIVFQILFITKNVNIMADKKKNTDKFIHDSIPVSSPKEFIIEKAMPYNSAPQDLKTPLDSGRGQYSMPVQSAPKEIKTPKNSTPDSTGNDKK